MEFCKLFFTDQHTKVVGACCPIIISRLNGKIHKAFYKIFFFLNTLLSTCKREWRIYKSVISNKVYFYRGQSISDLNIYEWSQLKLILSMMEASFLSKSFSSTICITVSLVQKTIKYFTEKLFFKPKHSLNSTAHPHKNYTWIQSELEFGLVMVSNINK